MANVIGKRVNGNLVYVDAGAHQMRVVDAIGPDVIKYEFSPWVHNVQDENATGTDPEGFFTTVVEGGTGTSEMDQSNTVGILAQLVTAADENDGISLQLVGPQFEFTGNQGLVYFGIEIDIDDVDQTDILVGLCVEDTALLSGVDDGVYIKSVDEAATISNVTEKSTTETETASAGTLTDDNFHFLEFYFDGSSVYFAFDGTVNSTIHTTNIPDDVVLTPSIEFLSGASGANTCDIRQMRAIQVGRT
jgi:uncharacterized ParB-like nuclease family protein